eukprot:1060762-Rhodomonas_salina.4
MHLQQKGCPSLALGSSPCKYSSQFKNLAGVFDCITRVSASFWHAGGIHSFKVPPQAVACLKLCSMR